MRLTIASPELLEDKNEESILKAASLGVKGKILPLTEGAIGEIQKLFDEYGEWAILVDGKTGLFSIRFEYGWEDKYVRLVED